MLILECEPLTPPANLAAWDTRRPSGVVLASSLGALSRPCRSKMCVFQASLPLSAL